MSLARSYRHDAMRGRAAASHASALAVAYSTARRYEVMMRLDTTVPGSASRQRTPVLLQTHLVALRLQVHQVTGERDTLPATDLERRIRCDLRIRHVQRNLALLQGKLW